MLVKRWKSPLTPIRDHSTDSAIGSGDDVTQKPCPVRVAFLRDLDGELHRSVAVGG